MRIGISGHQRREGIDWRWVRQIIDDVLDKHPGRHSGYSSLAIGSDQVFAHAILSRGDELIAVIPAADYESCFQSAELISYQNLKKQAFVISLEAQRSNEGAFYTAGRFIVQQTELLIAVWDGKMAEGLGGTADVVAYALSVSKAVTHVNPVTRRVEGL